MTREQAKREIDHIDFYLQHHTDDYSERSHDAMMMAIQALENHDTFMKYAYSYGKADALSQEPCDDAISREDAEQMFRNIRSHLKPQDYKSAEEFNTRDLMLLNAEQMIHALPSVTQKSGKWIEDEYGNVICSGCKRFRRDCRYGHTNYCNHCGAKMVEPKESEDKE